MKAYLVMKVFGSAMAEGVMFTDRRDALDAMSGTCQSGAVLAIDWCDTYGESSDEFKLVEIEINESNFSAEDSLYTANVNASGAR
jgi:hypothetical protein